MKNLLVSLLVLGVLVACGKKEDEPNVQGFFDKKEAAPEVKSVYGLFSGQSKEGKSTYDIRVQIVEGRETVTIANRCTFEGSTEVKYAAIHIKAIVTNSSIRFTEEKKDGDSSCEVHIKQSEFKIELSGNQMKWTNAENERESLTFTRLKD